MLNFRVKISVTKIEIYEFLPLEIFLRDIQTTLYIEISWRSI